MKKRVIEAWNFQYEEEDLRYVATIRRYDDRSLGASWEAHCLRCGSVSEESNMCPNKACGVRWGYAWNEASGAMLGRMMELHGIDPATAYPMSMSYPEDENSDGVVRVDANLTYVSRVLHEAKSK